MVVSNDEVDLRAEVGDASNVFVLAPTFTPDVEAWCSSLIDCASDRTEAVLYIASGPPSGHLERCRTNGSSGSLRRIGFLNLGGAGTPSGSSLDEVERDGVDVQIRSVESPGNLTKIGVELNEMLTDWADVDGAIAICFESLTPLIQYSDVENVYRFLHVLTNQVKAVDARAHYHLDPGAHDNTDVNLLLTMVDAVVEPADDGGVRIRQR